MRQRLSTVVGDFRKHGETRGANYIIRSPAEAPLLSRVPQIFQRRYRPAYFRSFSLSLCLPVVNPARTYLRMDTPRARVPKGRPRRNYERDENRGKETECVPRPSASSFPSASAITVIIEERVSRGGGGVSYYFRKVCPPFAEGPLYRYRGSICWKDSNAPPEVSRDTCPTFVCR